MKLLLQAALLLLITPFTFAQNNQWIYATMETEDALQLSANHPEGIEILVSDQDLSAVYMNTDTAMELKNSRNVHGPGYIYRKDMNTAVEALSYLPKMNMNVLDFDITEDAYVHQVLGQVSEENIENTIIELQNYGTRFHTKQSGIQASIDIKNNWENMVNEAGRDDVTVEHYDHSFTNQKSIILTFTGSESPDDIVIIGGHLDSGDYYIQNNAPGADDNASGIATITETLRILLANNFQPKRTVQIMAYAAEEVGLWGSQDIATEYAADNKNVLAVCQFDMTNYNGSSYDIAIVSDVQYTSSELNLFLIELLEHYNSTGAHKITYGTTYCGYGCSDHVSWNEKGYLASFPFEAAMNETNPNVHTTNDTYAAMGYTSEHSVKFVKLALEFVIELGKVPNMSVIDELPMDVRIAAVNKTLIYDLGNSSQKLESLVIFDASARRMISKNNLNPKGEISLQNLNDGMYIAVFRTADGKTVSKKFILK